MRRNQRQGSRPSTTGRQHDFAMIPSVQRPRSAFNRSCGLKTAFDGGYLIPIFVDEALPGDTINLRATVFSRLSTLNFPVIDNIYLDTFFFAIPNRLVWDNWQKFCGEQLDPGDSIDYTVPTMTSHATLGHLQGSLSDFLGIPINVPGLTHSCLWHRAYNLVYREWFRDENLVDSPVVDTDDDPSTDADYVLRRSGKRHDYFTSALPWPQKGDAIELSLGTTAPLTIDAGEVFNIDANGTPSFNVTAGPSGVNLTTEGSSTNNLDISTTSSVAGNLSWNSPALDVDIGGATGVTDLSTATAQTINSIREAFQFQKLLERDARGGTRYTEIVRSHFGVISPDQRLQRPEFLGGNTTRVVVSAVERTSGNYVADLHGYGIAADMSAGFTKSFTEHCLILGLVRARADLTYQQGLPRMFSRGLESRYDFYWPTLAHLGEQAILNKEIYAQGTDDAAADAAAFGYQERWAEYRYKPSILTNTMRSTHSASLDAWHCAQEFDDLPTLGQTFIEEDPPFDRIVAVSSEPHFLADFFFDFKHVRPMPTYSVPGLIDHF